MIHSKYSILFLLLTLFVSCSTTQHISRKDKKIIRHSIESSPVFSSHFTGFMLYDPLQKEVLLEQNAHQYFTPASNTKILTFFTALQILKDSVELLQYATKGDSIVIQGMANPVFLHPKFEQFPLPSFFEDSSKMLFLSFHNFQDDRYGEGWMWDDYNYAFQTEKTPFPIYENNIQIELKAGSDYPIIRPKYFEAAFTQEKNKGDRLRIFREEKDNLFKYQLPEESDKDLLYTRPFITTAAITAALLADTLHREINVWQKSPENLHFVPIRIPMQDTVYRRLLHQSDNFIAEQLLLMCSQKLWGYQNTKEMITYAKDSIFQFLTDELMWVDGSGISRYNLFTPSALVQILDVLQQQISMERIQDLFPSGGTSGTVEGWYGPYLFAKTGTLRNNHNLSGYIITRRGRLLIFSFMNNHFKGGSSRIKEAMEKVLEEVYRRL